MINLKRLRNSFRHAGRGIRQAYQRENTLRVHFLAILLLVLASFATQLNRFEVIAVTLATGLVIVLELVNTAIEKLADHLHPSEHKEIGFVKDVLAGSVLIASITALIVCIAVFYPHL
jgi:undecaprenol kinase